MPQLSKHLPRLRTLLVITGLLASSFSLCAQRDMLDHWMVEETFASFGEQAGQAVNYAAGVSATAAEFNQEFAQVKQAYWQAIARGEDPGSLRARYGELLWQRDVWYAAFRIAEGNKGGMATDFANLLMGGGVGGNIPAHLEPALIAWTEAIRHNLDPERFGGLFGEDNNSIVLSPAELQAALAMDLPQKRLYLLKRDWSEHHTAGFETAYYPDAKSFLLYAIYDRLNYHDPERAGRMVQTMVDLVGEETLLAGAEHIRTQPKNADGKLVGPYGGPYHRRYTPGHDCFTNIVLAVTPTNDEQRIPWAIFADMMQRPIDPTVVDTKSIRDAQAGLEAMFGTITMAEVAASTEEGQPPYSGYIYRLKQADPEALGRASDNQGIVEITLDKSHRIPWDAAHEQEYVRASKSSRGAIAFDGRTLYRSHAGKAIKGPAGWSHAGQVTLIPLGSPRNARILPVAPPPEGGWSRAFGQALAVQDGIIYLGDPDAEKDRDATGATVQLAPSQRSASPVQHGPRRSHYGHHIVTTSDHLAISAPYAGDERQGTVYLKSRPDGRAVAKLTPTTAHRQFGNHLRMSDDYLAVAAYGDNGAVRGHQPLPGTIFLYATRTGQGLAQINPGWLNPTFGNKMALVGDRIAVLDYQSGYHEIPHVFDATNGQPVGRLSPMPTDNFGQGLVASRVAQSLFRQNLAQDVAGADGLFFAQLQNGSVAIFDASTLDYLAVIARPTRGPDLQPTAYAGDTLILNHTFYLPKLSRTLARSSR